MMRQYANIKKQYQDAILFFRLGDFYEMFLDDAKLASEILGITLTARNKGKDGKIPMCGVPYHAAESYIQKLVRNGHKVAICEQITTPQKGKDIVEREVIRVVTPSTVLSENDELSTNNDYLMTFSLVKKTIGYALVSVKSGDVLVLSERLPDLSVETILKHLQDKINRFKPVELLVLPILYDDPNSVRALFLAGVNPFRFEPSIKTSREAKDFIKEYYDVDTLEGFGLEGKDSILLALANALNYISSTQQSSFSFLKYPKLVVEEGVMYLPSQTIRNLELFYSMRRGDSKVSLYSVLNNTYTPMGGRLLRGWLLRPLNNKEEINSRYDVVSFFVDDRTLSDKLSHILSETTDIERSLGRLALKVGNARDLVALGVNLQNALKVKELLPDNVPTLLVKSLEKISWDTVSQVADLVLSAIKDEPAATLREGGIIRDGYDPKLDELRAIAKGGKEWLEKLEQTEREKTGIASLKVGFNKVFGYYIEVSKANTDKVPDYYVRKQTLTNAERYIIDELKKHEETVLRAQEQVNALEFELFNKIVDQVVQESLSIQFVSELTALVDVLLGFASLAVSNNYIRPEVVDEHIFEVEAGRHPIVELIMSEQFVPNDINLFEDERMMIITGANMAGKSTYIRQAALLAIMAQIGAFVPANKMRFGLFDKILTRIGAMDDLASGMSTFMVEMVETANILNIATDRSLIILDEIGRGTSTFDGLSIAWSVSEHLLTKTKAFIMFATHYHELTELSNTYEHVDNYHMSVAERDDGIIFLYRVTTGKASQSYGIEVAKRAGLPKSVTKRASEILHNLTSQSRAISPISGKQLDLFSEFVSKKD